MLTFVVKNMLTNVNMGIIIQNVRTITIDSQICAICTEGGYYEGKE